MTGGVYAIPLTDVVITEADIEATLAAVQDGWRMDGPRVASFEQAFAAHTGTGHAIAVANGTAALHLALLAAGVGPGDEVLVPALTFVASAAAVRYCGAAPVLCDVVSPTAPLIDPADAAARVTASTRAVVAVHMYGYPADVAALRAFCDERDILVIEDVAQAIGARLADGTPAGAGGAVGCFSLFSKKQLCVGEGGVVTTLDPDRAELLRALRSPAGSPGGAGIPMGPGIPMGLGEPHAALAHSRLARLDADIAARRATVRAYRERLHDVAGLELTFDDAAVEDGSHFAFPVLADDVDARNALRDALRGRGIQSTYYPSLTQLTAYAGSQSRYRAEEAADRHLCLPLSSSTTEEQVDAVVAVVREALAPVSRR